MTMFPSSPYIPVFQLNSFVSVLAVRLDTLPRTGRALKLFIMLSSSPLLSVTLLVSFPLFSLLPPFVFHLAVCTLPLLIFW